MYDIFFISYDEEIADQNWNILRSKYNHARRIHGIKGINNAHKQCATQSYTEMFWTVDADTVANDNFKFDFNPPEWDKKYLHLWYSKNPVNDLNYGYGSIKLWPKKSMLEIKENWLDFTTTVGNIKIVDDVVATTHFNFNRYSAWKSAFRESIKLCYNVINGDTDASLERLLIWANKKNSVPFASDVIDGSRDGIDYFLKNKNDEVALKNINDFDWLKNIYEKSIPNKKIKEIYRNDILYLLKIADYV